MELIEKEDWPVLFIDANICLDTEQGRRISSVIKELENRLGCSVIISLTCQDGREVIESRADLGCIVLDWDFDVGSSPTPQDLVKLVRKINTEIPVLIMTDKASISCIAVDVLDKMLDKRNIYP